MVKYNVIITKCIDKYINIHTFDNNAIVVCPIRNCSLSIPVTIVEPGSYQSHQLSLFPIKLLQFSTLLSRQCFSAIEIRRDGLNFSCLTFTKPIIKYSLVRDAYSMA